MVSVNRPARLALTGVFTALLACGAAQAQLRVATWNVTTYTGGFQSEIQTAVYGEYNDFSFAPDIILGQEFFSQSAVDDFTAALNTASGSPGDWDAVFVPDSGGYEGNVMFYRTGCVSYLSFWVASPDTLPAGPRKVICYKVRLQGYSTNHANLYLYNSHMKAGTTASDQARRLAEAENIRANAENVLNPAYHFLLGADLNMQTSAEAAYQALVGSQLNNDGRFFDPINRPGTWHDSPTYRFIHTQDPWASMDDRFDQILVNDNLLDGTGFEYIGDSLIPFSATTWDDPNHSHRTWGNDGSSFNQPLRVTGNAMVGPAIAQALRTLATSSGGHVPVYLDLRVPARIGTDPVDQIDFGQVPQGVPAEAVLSVWNDGDVALWTAAGLADLSYEMLAGPDFGAPAGTFVAGPGAAPAQHVITMDTSTLGVKTGVLTILATGADEQTRSFQLTGEVVAPSGCPGDCNCDDVVSWRDIDFFVAGMNDNEPAWRDMFLPDEPACPFDNCDVNGDGTVSWRDIDPLVAVMNTTCP